MIPHCPLPGCGCASFTALDGVKCSVKADATDAAIGSAIGYVCGTPEFRQKCGQPPLSAVLTGEGTTATKANVLFNEFWVARHQSDLACDFGGIAQIVTDPGYKQTRGLVMTTTLAATCDAPCTDWDNATTTARTGTSTLAARHTCYTCRQRMHYLTTTTDKVEYWNAQSSSWGLVSGPLSPGDAQYSVHNSCAASCTPECNPMWAQTADTTCALQPLAGGFAPTTFEQDPHSSTSDILTYASQRVVAQEACAQDLTCCGVVETQCGHGGFQGCRCIGTYSLMAQEGSCVYTINLKPVTAQ